MKEYTFHYGRGTKKFSLDESRVLKEIVMPKQPLLEDIKGAVLDAIEHPEKHENLIVRIGGYSEYFNRLTPGLQQTVLRRTEY